MANTQPGRALLIYIRDGQTGAVTLGQEVRYQKLDLQKDNRLFRNFKRGIVTSPAPEPRTIDDKVWGDNDAGKTFVHTLLSALPIDSTSWISWC
ncbi:MAG: hypothetical protein IPK17_05095 [Chloroflexi bacterium]|uniref:hypothetical protein n=1 Tax=Candidatus Flexifilum breve TaxID=3140694 RepID=UPI0031350F1D|nr:hypothetical protein [Chloroflexota bacterium]